MSILAFLVGAVVGLLVAANNPWIATKLKLWSKATVKSVEDDSEGA